MMDADPIGIPALVVLAIALVTLAVSVLAARRRGGGEERGSGTRSHLSLAGIVVQMVGIALAGVGPVRPTLPPTAPKAVVDAVIVAMLASLSIALFVWASRTMGRNWSLVARTRDDHQLVQSGPFAWVRHPIYTALASFTLAIAVAYGHLSHLWIAAPVYALGTGLRVREEERLLRARFGTAYDAYAAQVKRFVPGLF